MRANELPILKSNTDELIREKEVLTIQLRSVQGKLEYHQVACLKAIKEDDVRTKFYTGLSTLSVH